MEKRSTSSAEELISLLISDGMYETCMLTIGLR